MAGLILSTNLIWVRESYISRAQAVRCSARFLDECGRQLDCSKDNTYRFGQK